MLMHMGVGLQESGMQGAGCRVQGAEAQEGAEVQRCRGAVMDICRVQRQRQ